jgi:hypothetical protein
VRNAAHDADPKRLADDACSSVASLCYDLLQRPRRMAELKGDGRSEIDIGASAIQVPQVNTAEQARRHRDGAVFQLLTGRGRSTIVPWLVENTSSGISPCLSYI